MKVKLVQSGRWAEEPAQVVELLQEELAPRAVSAEEALNGVGTFVGGVICTSRVRPGAARVWDYGLVIGYSWESDLQHGLLDVNFSGTETSVKFVSSTTQDVAVEIYALQPCAGQSTSFVMAGEMKQIHDKVYNKFNGIDQPAVRDATQLLDGIRSDELDETRILPLLDIGNFAIVEVSIHHILDYVYYKDGGRPHPSGAVFGETIFDQPNAQQEPREQPNNDVVMSDGLSDSDDDDNIDTPIASSGRSSNQQREAKRRRLNVQERAVPPGSIQLEATSHGIGGSSNVTREVDQLIALQRNTSTMDALSPLVARREDGSADKNQFHATGMQTAIHLGLVNGKYASMTAQRFVEFVQIHWRKFGFFPHPAVLRALFGWDFGTRGLSILHFGRVTEQEKRKRVRAYDMSNFSKKNSLPPAQSPVDFTTLVGSVDVLCAITQLLYKPVVHETLKAASDFLSELRVSELASSQQALDEIAAWVDDQLELFRLAITEDNWQAAADIKTHFRASHDSFIRVHQMILRQDVIAAVKSTRAGSGNHSRSGRASGADKRVPIPLEVRQALPKQGNQQICLRFLSAQGCRGKNGGCVIKHLCHFKPASLPEIVRDFLSQNYGGLSADMQ